MQGSNIILFAALPIQKINDSLIIYSQIIISLLRGLGFRV